MKYIEIVRGDARFEHLELKDILLSIKMHVRDISWSVQYIDAVGDITSILGFPMKALEDKCKSSRNGVILPFETLIDLSAACDDIIDVLLVGCKKESDIPKANAEDGWESHCDIIISREDSTIWELFSTIEEIMQIFNSFKSGIN